MLGKESGVSQSSSSTELQVKPPMPPPPETPPPAEPEPKKHKKETTIVLRAVDDTKLSGKGTWIRSVPGFMTWLPREASHWSNLNERMVPEFEAEFAVEENPDTYRVRRACDSSVYCHSWLKRTPSKNTFPGDRGRHIIVLDPRMPDQAASREDDGDAEARAMI